MKHWVSCDEIYALAENVQLNKFFYCVEHNIPTTYRISILSSTNLCGNMISNHTKNWNYERTDNVLGNISQMRTPLFFIVSLPTVISAVYTRDDKYIQKINW